MIKTISTQQQYPPYYLFLSLLFSTGSPLLWAATQQDRHQEVTPLQAKPDQRLSSILAAKQPVEHSPPALVKEKEETPEQILTRLKQIKITKNDGKAWWLLRFRPRDIAGRSVIAMLNEPILLRPYTISNNPYLTYAVEKQAQKEHAYQLPLYYLLQDLIIRGGCLDGRSGYRTWKSAEQQRGWERTLLEQVDHAVSAVITAQKEILRKRNSHWQAEQHKLKQFFGSANWDRAGIQHHRSQQTITALVDRSRKKPIPAYRFKAYQVPTSDSSTTSDSPIANDQPTQHHEHSPQLPHLVEPLSSSAPSLIANACRHYHILRKQCNQHLIAEVTHLARKLWWAYAIGGLGLLLILAIASYHHKEILTLATPTTL